MTETETEEFSVYQYFEDGSYERVRDHVGPREAVEAAHHYCNSVAAKCGITRKVIITDGGDLINFQWEYGKGITFK
jgi:hypothetical protein